MSSGVAVLVEVGDEHVSALAGESDRHRPADTAVTAGDDRGLSREAPVADVAALTAVWDGCHLRLDAWDVLLLGGLAHGASYESIPRVRELSPVHTPFRGP